MFAPNIGQYQIKSEIWIVHTVSQFPIIYLLKNKNKATEEDKKKDIL